MNVKSVMQEWRTKVPFEPSAQNRLTEQLNAKSSLIEGERNVNEGFITSNGLPPNIF